MAEPAPKHELALAYVLAAIADLGQRRDSRFATRVDKRFTATDARLIDFTGSLGRLEEGQERLEALLERTSDHGINRDYGLRADPVCASVFLNS